MEWQDFSVSFPIMSGINLLTTSCKSICLHVFHAGHDFHHLLPDLAEPVWYCMENILWIWLLHVLSETNTELVEQITISCLDININHSLPLFDNGIHFFFLVRSTPWKLVRHVLTSTLWVISLNFRNENSSFCRSVSHQMWLWFLKSLWLVLFKCF